MKKKEKVTAPRVSRSAPPAQTLDVDTIRALAAIVDEHGLTELRLRLGLVDVCGLDVVDVRSVACPSAYPRWVGRVCRAQPRRP